MKNEDLIKKLLEKKIISEEVVSRLMKDAELKGTSVEDLIYQNKLADDVLIAQIKSEILNIPYKKIDPSEIDENLLNLIPKDVSKNYAVIPIKKDKDLLIVGMLHPDNLGAQEALKFIAKKEGVSLGVYLISLSDLLAVWKKYTPYKSEIELALGEIGKLEKVDSLLVSLDEEKAGEDAPIIKIVSATLREAVERKASDIHIEPQRFRLRIRFRVDGDLEEVTSLPIALAQPIVSRIKVLSKLKLDETRIPQDGRFRAQILGRDIDFRVATFPTPSGEKVVLRVLDPNAGVKNLNDLGLIEYNRKLIEEALNSPYGMILITGPTGSGKSTTLYAMIKEINSEEINIVTLEDPVEYFMDGVNQSQVKPEIGYDFSSGLRQILRQDPDVIMVGEIRDSETANLAVNAALTGHLMFSTLHTNNALGVIPRLIDLGVPPFLLAPSLNLMIAQRLLGRLCPNCKKEKNANEIEEKLIDENLKNLPPEIKNKIKKPYKLWYVEPNKSCEICNGKGVLGRVAIFEILKMTKELSQIITKGFEETMLEEEARRQGMITMRQDGIMKALQGEVSLEEVLRETAD
jgi:type IV pilus assembly protein PilB